MARRRRGRRRPGEHEGAGQPGRVGADGLNGNSLHTPDGYAGIPSPSRWSHMNTQRPRRPDDGRSRWSAGQGQQPQRRFGGEGNAPRFARTPGSGPQAPRRPRPPQTAPPPRRSGPPPQIPAGSTIDSFDLFCAYHLGITQDDGYRIQNIHEVARRFGTNAAALRQTLTALGMDADDIVHSGFDLASAQIDIMVAPAGISRRELARPLFDEFRSAPRRSRNWAKEMEEAARAIETTIGREGAWSPGPRDRTGKQS